MANGSVMMQNYNVRDAVIDAVKRFAFYSAGDAFVARGRRAHAFKETLFWRTALASPGMTRLVIKNNLPTLRLHAAEKIVVPLNTEIGTTQTALLLLDPSFPDGGLTVLEDASIAFTEDDLAEGWLNVVRIADRQGIRMNVPGALEGMAMRGRLRDRDVPAFVLAGKLPDLELTSVPSPALSVSTSPASIGTAGVATTNKAGLFGVTAPYHAFVTGTSSPATGAAVTVGPSTGTIESVDQVSDSCFISIGSTSGIPLRPFKGRLDSVTPRMNQPAEFEGVTSGKTSTTILGWSPDLPFVQPFSQLKVYTAPDTNRGDSGAALIDSDDFLIGFAFYRTTLTGALQYSAWVWAESVYQAHSLN